MSSHAQRLKRLQETLETDALLIENPIHLFYLTGLEVSLGTLFLKPHEGYLLVDPRYIEVCQKQAPLPVICTEKRPLKDLIKLGKLEGIQTLGFDAGSTSFSSFQSHQREIRKADPHLQLVPLDAPLQELRAVKDTEELAALRQAAQLGNEGFNYVLSLLKPGVTEAEVAKELEIFWLRKQAKGLAFDPIIAFGANSSMPHYLPGDQKLQATDAILIDIGVTLNHYHSDMTRTVFLSEPSPQWKEIYETVREAQLKALELCKPGTPMGELDAAARGHIASKGYGAQFSHSLGHGIGLDVHEYPILRSTGSSKNDLLKEGMVLTIEPGIYVPDFGGVRIEDTIIITRNGYESLTLPTTDLRVL